MQISGHREQRLASPIDIDLCCILFYPAERGDTRLKSTRGYTAESATHNHLQKVTAKYKNYVNFFTVKVAKTVLR